MALQIYRPSTSFFSSIETQIGPSPNFRKPNQQYGKKQFTATIYVYTKRSCDARQWRRWATDHTRPSVLCFRCSLILKCPFLWNTRKLCHHGFRRDRVPIVLRARSSCVFRVRFLVKFFLSPPQSFHPETQYIVVLYILSLSHTLYIYIYRYICMYVCIFYHCVFATSKGTPCGE